MLSEGSGSGSVKKQKVAMLPMDLLWRMVSDRAKNLLVGPVVYTRVN